MALNVYHGLYIVTARALTVTYTETLYTLKSLSLYCGYQYIIVATRHVRYGAKQKTNGKHTAYLRSARYFRLRANLQPRFVMLLRASPT